MGLFLPIGVFPGGTGDLLGDLPAGMPLANGGPLAGLFPPAAPMPGGWEASSLLGAGGAFFGATFEPGGGEGDLGPGEGLFFPMGGPFGTGEVVAGEVAAGVGDLELGIPLGGMPAAPGGPFIFFGEPAVGGIAAGGDRKSVV